LVQTVDTRGTTNQMAYCDCGSPATVVEAAGTSIARTASYEYDFQGKRWKTTTPEGSMSTNHYDLLGRLVLVQDPFGWSTNRYDNLGRLVQTLNAAGSQMLLSHDVLDRVRIRTDLNGVTITGRYAYDRGGGLTNVSSPGYSGNVARTYAYDALGRMTNMTDAVGTTAYAYTLLGSGISAMSEDGPWTNDVVNVTNRHGLRSHLVIIQPAGSFTTTYQWDASRRMTNVTGGGQSFGYVYGSPGRQITRVNLPGGGYITNTFDSLARQTGTELLTSGGVTRNRHAYVYDAADRRTWISRTNSTSTTWNGFSVFGYDAGSQLTTARTTNAANTEVTSERFGYVYDASQNLRWRTNNTTVTGFTNNVLNQLTALNAMARDHDRRGNLLSNVQAGETLLYSWDDESQLTSVQMDPASTPAFQPWRIDFVYDGLRRLRRALQFTWNGSAWTSQGETRYLYGGMLIVQERNSGNTPQVTYTRGLDLSGTIEGAGGIGGLLMRSHGYSAGNWSTHNAYHSDANGNVTALMNSAGVLQASYKYNPYGGLISSSGTLAGANTMRFSSKPAIFSATGAWGFYYYGYRFYDPGMQRWLNRDPIEEEGGGNLYGFIANNPVNDLDAFGLQTSGSATLALEPTLLMSEEAAAAYCARQAAKAAAVAAAALAAKQAAEMISETKQYGKGERNWAHESDNPWKGWRVHPQDPTKIKGRDQHGKDVIKPRPPGFPDPKSKPQPAKPNPAPKPPEAKEGGQQPPKPEQAPQPKESGK
jgi:RHS repeat-associated protein